jgi:hypothetical protein
VQLAGHALSEALLVRAGHAYEQATPWHSLHPITSSIDWRWVANFLPYSRPTLRLPHRLSVGAWTRYPRPEGITRLPVAAPIFGDREAGCPSS